MPVSSNGLGACLGRFRNSPVESCSRSTVVEGIYKEQIGDAVHEQVFPKNDWNSALRNEFKRPAFEWIGKAFFARTQGHWKACGLK